MALPLSFQFTDAATERGILAFVGESLNLTPVDLTSLQLGASLALLSSPESSVSASVDGLSFTPDVPGVYRLKVTRGDGVFKRLRAVVLPQSAKTHMAWGRLEGRLDVLRNAVAFHSCPDEWWSDATEAYPMPTNGVNPKVYGG